MREDEHAELYTETPLAGVLEGMKTKEVIRRLQEADPSGELECVVGGTDIYFMQREAMYYDGTPVLLVHDPAKRDRCYSVVGLRVPSPNGPDKVQIHLHSPADVFIDHLDCPVEYEPETEHHKPRIEAIRQECSDIIDRVDNS